MLKYVSGTRDVKNKQAGPKRYWRDHSEIKKHHNQKIFKIIVKQWEKNVRICDTCNDYVECSEEAGSAGCGHSKASRRHRKQSDSSHIHWIANMKGTSAHSLKFAEVSERYSCSVIAIKESKFLKM